MTRGSNKGHIARAALEGIAHQVCDVLYAMSADLSAQSDTDILELRVDGGASQNNLLLQTQANLLQIPVVRPQITETTALGAAYLAGLAAGFWQSQNELTQFWKVDRRFVMAPPRARTLGHCCRKITRLGVNAKVKQRSSCKKRPRFEP